MPYRINGFGTGLVRASRVWKREGERHFDAVEAVTALYLPLVPYRVIHVMGIRPKGMVGNREDYQSLPLRFSWRIVAKAFLHAWAGVLALVGTFFVVLFGIATVNMERPVTTTDVVILSVLAVLACLGAGLWLVWRWVDAHDRWIRVSIGSHGIGASDPIDWDDHTAAEFKSQILSATGQPDLLAAARQAQRQGDHANAVLRIRLAQRLAPNEDFEQELAGLQRDAEART